MGLWIVIVTALVIALNVMLYLYAEERWAGLYSWDESLHSAYLSHRMAFMGVMILETALFVVGAVLLAKFTSHRIAGPYIKIVNVCNAVRDGDVDQIMKFRTYDKLDYVEKAFNDMLASLRSRMR
jgi:nitrogen fixation/metabolism regulation signal transduction histidine kinase